MRNYRDVGIRSFGAASCTNENACRPGCSLPCCVPSRRCSTSPRKPRCLFIPPPALTTKRYCGDPCSPPPPGCTQRPDRGPFSLARAKNSRCAPCAPPRLSPRSYGQPCRPRPKPFSSCNPCGPRKCGPPDPCVSKCDPCRPRITNFCITPKVDPCCTTRMDHCSIASKYDKCGATPSACSTRPRSRRSIVSTPRCPPRRSASRFSSSCASSYCDSPPAYKRCGSSRRCSSCDCDPCSCGGADKCSSDGSEKCSGNEEASKGPTSWFLKKTGKLGTGTAPMEPHFCPWEADVTVTGTVRGHCTSTAVEVAKRLTGKFLSRGQRYTYKETPSTSCSNGSGKRKSQVMALGCLDDGTKLDFTRKKCSEDADDAASQSITNNATTDSTAGPPSKAWRFFGTGGYLEVKEAKRSSRGEVTWATAYIRGDGDDERTSYVKQEERPTTANSVQYRRESGAFARRCESDRRGKRRSRSRGRVRAASVGSDTDQSSYRTASEMVQDRSSVSFNRRPSHHTQGADDGRYKGRRRDVGHTEGDRYLKEKNNSWQAWRKQPDSSDEDQIVHEYYNDENDSEEESRGFEEDDFGSNNEALCNDDSDVGDPHSSQYKRSMADRCARGEDRRHPSHLTYSTRSRADGVSRERRLKGRNSSRPPGKSGYLVYSTRPQSYPDPRQSSEEELRDVGGKSSQPMLSNFIDKKRGGRRSSHSNFYNRRKRVTYDDEL